MGHTKGPWRVDHCSYGEEIWNHEGRYVADLKHGEGTGAETTAANANLIAAAPDLLEALERTAEYLEEAHQSDIDFDHAGDDPAECTYCQALKQAQAAIAKAKGEAE